MSDYLLMSDVTADVSESMMAGVAPVELLPMPVEIGGTDFLYGTPESMTMSEFYRRQREGQFAATAQTIRPISSSVSTAAIIPPHSACHSRDC